MKYFVCSDIHGHFNEWMDALANAGYHPNDINHKIIICGDLFDRGRQPQEVIDYILNNEDKIIIVKGNHEDLTEMIIKNNGFCAHDYLNGAAQTFDDLAKDKLWIEHDVTTQQVAEESRLTEVLSRCYNYYETENYIFVHGWIPLITEQDMPMHHQRGRTYQFMSDWRNASEKDWQLARWRNGMEMAHMGFIEKNKTIVCGHWHTGFGHFNYHNEGKTEFDNFDIYKDKGIIALDACTAYSHKINILVVEEE